MPRHQSARQSAFRRALIGVLEDELRIFVRRAGPRCCADRRLAGSGRIEHHQRTVVGFLVPALLLRIRWQRKAQRDVDGSAGAGSLIPAQKTYINTVPTLSLR